MHKDPFVPCNCGGPDSEYSSGNAVMEHDVGQIGSRLQGIQGTKGRETLNVCVGFHGRCYIN